MYVLKRKRDVKERECMLIHKQAVQLLARQLETIPKTRRLSCESSTFLNRFITYSRNHEYQVCAASPLDRTLHTNERACTHTTDIQRIRFQPIPPPGLFHTRVCPCMPLRFGACAGGGIEGGRGRRRIFNSPCPFVSYACDPPPHLYPPSPASPDLYHLTSLRPGTPCPSLTRSTST